MDSFYLLWNILDQGLKEYETKESEKLWGKTDDSRISESERAEMVRIRLKNNYINTTKTNNRLGTCGTK